MNRRVYRNSKPKDFIPDYTETIRHYENKCKRKKDPPVPNKSGFQVRDMNTRNFFIAKDDDFESDTSNAKRFILAYLSEIKLKAIKEDKKIIISFNNSTFYIGEEPFMKVNNKLYGLSVIQNVLSSLSKDDKHISYSAENKGSAVCSVTYKSFISIFKSQED